MNQINIKYLDGSKKFGVSESELASSSQLSRPLIEELILKLNLIGIRKTTNFWIALGTFVIIILFASFFLIIFTIYMLALSGVTLIILLIIFFMSRRSFRRIRQKVTSLASEYRIKLIEWYELQETGMIFSQSTRTNDVNIIIILRPIVINLAEENLQVITTEPIPFYTYFPKKESSNQIMITSENNLLTQPITPFQELASPQLQVGGFRQGQNMNSDIKKAQTNNPPILEEIEISNQMIAVNSLPPTPQNLPPKLAIESVYVIPGRHLP